MPGVNVPSERLLPELDGFVPEGVQVGLARIHDCVSELFASETPAIAKAIDSRRHEYATGRVLARGLLADLGHEAAPLVYEKKTRLPVWPAGAIGSISHSDDLCIVGVAQTARYRGLGLDVEPDEPVRGGVERIVLQQGDDSTEWSWAEEGGDAAEFSRRTRIVFSVKEAVYKAFYPLTRDFWNFHDVSVEIDLDAGRFRAEVPPTAFGQRAEGRVLRRSGWILSSVTLPILAVD